MEINRTVPEGSIQGFCDPAFDAVLTAFTENFETRREAGASICINIKGKTVVDLWGGSYRQGQTLKTWDKDNLCIVFSCTKAATALCAHRLIDEGKLDLQARVADYWPEFANNGKQDITVEMMLNHSSALPALREPVKPGGYYDWDYMVKRLEAEAPFWPPGTRNGYHMLTFGWTIGELVRRVSGQSLGDYFRSEIAEPLGLDFWIGLPDEHHHRVAPVMQSAADKGAQLTPFVEALIHDRNSIQYLALMNNGKQKTNSPEHYRAEIGGGGGISNARAIAGLYNPLANKGRHNGYRLVSEAHLERMQRTSIASLSDATLLMPTRFALGFMKSMDNRHRPSGHMESLIMGPRAFGHAGAGGSLGFADDTENLAFGYTMNRMGPGLLLNTRGQSLVDATYRSLGYSSDTSGVWTR